MNHYKMMAADNSLISLFSLLFFDVKVFGIVYKRKFNDIEVFDNWKKKSKRQKNETVIQRKTLKW